tara:strand:+ start:935 stop:1153 length:219 start_codon:yes stop_codon:yes gene_type:complete
MMKMNGNVSVGNILTIAVILFSVAVGWGSIQANVNDIDNMVKTKANKDVVDIQFLYIQKQLDEIKTLIKERN